MKHRNENERPLSNKTALLIHSPDFSSNLSRSAGGSYLESFMGGQIGKAGFQSCSEVTPGHVSSLGVPKALHKRT